MIPILLNADSKKTYVQTYAMSARRKAKKKLGIGVVRDCTANKILCIEHVLENPIHLSKDTAVILVNTLKCIDKLYSVQIKGDILDTAATVAAADTLGLKHEHIEL